MRKWIRRSFKIVGSIVGVLVLGGLIYFVGGGTPFRMDKGDVLEPGKYEVAWAISTGQKIPDELRLHGKDGQLDESRVKWSRWRNWVVFPIRPEGGTFYRIAVLYSPMFAEEYWFVHGPSSWTVNPPHPHPHPNS